MTDRHASTRSDIARQAMDVVLDAEHRAQVELDDCARDAEAVRTRARETARHIQHRTQARITGLHKACEGRTAARVREMKREAVSAVPAIRADSTEDTVIREAAANLARRLTVSEDDGHQ